MKNDSFCVSLTLNAWLLSRSTFVPWISHAVSLFADIESRTRQKKKKKILKQVVILQILFNSHVLLFFTRFFVEKKRAKT